MKVCVVGLWHLGSVTAACVASLGHEVVGYDPNDAEVAALREGQPPVGEPRLRELIQEQFNSERLSFTSDASHALRGAQVVWVTFDTPVDEDDNADVEQVMLAVQRTFHYLDDGALVLISSQLPVGSTRELERKWAATSHGRKVTFAYSPENLRLGKAIEIFLSPDRIVIGTRGEGDERLIELFGSLADRIVWMGTESAEMTKHAVNAFLATSVTFINEIARLCEVVGADASEVERGLKTEARIGPKAYLGPGAAFAGGTLARDVRFLRAIGTEQGRSTPFFDGLAESNNQHRSWTIERIERVMGRIHGSRIAVWGLTYKAGTTTLRRSDAVMLCNDLFVRGAVVFAHDPTVTQAPSELHPGVLLAADPVKAATNADLVVVATAWPQYRDVTGDCLFAAMERAVVIDANRFLGSTIGADSRFEYFSVGRDR